MKTAPIKLAGIVTVVCGSLCPFEVGAAFGDTPAIAVGSVRPEAPEASRASDALEALDVTPTADATIDTTASPAPFVAGDDAAQTRDARAGDADPAWASAGLSAVSESRLDGMRGGFDLPSGLMVSFGITRAAFVNGDLVAQTSFNIPDIAHMTAQQAQMLANANTGALIQVGSGNAVQPGALPGLTGAVIQNTLNGQQIQAITTLNTTVNSLGAFTATNFLSTLNSALTGVARPR